LTVAACLIALVLWPVAARAQHSGPIVGWGDQVAVESAEPLELEQNFPNPFNEATIIRFYVPREALGRLEIYDTAGRRVKTLLKCELLGIGHHEVVWDGRSDSGLLVSSGIYYCRLVSSEMIYCSFSEAEKSVQTRKLVLMR